MKNEMAALVGKVKKFVEAEKIRRPKALVKSSSPFAHSPAVREALLDQALDRMPALKEAPKASQHPAAPWATNLSAFKAQICECQNCPLGATRKNFVFGSGSHQARIAFIGGVPALDDERKGEPFSGAAGELLNKIIQAMRLRREDAYLLNLVKCRPPQDRQALPEELQACSPYYEQQLALLKPMVIVALGEEAAIALCGIPGDLAKHRGRFFQWRGVPVLATHHPLAVLRNEALKRPVWDDMKLVVQKLKEVA